MKATLNEEMMKLFRLISLHCWSLNDDDIANDTNTFECYINDIINYLATGDATLTITATAEADNPDVDFTKTKAMLVSTIEYIDEFKAKQDEVQNKANRNKII